MSDYAKKTARLTLAQHGAYTLLLDEVYTTEQPLPADVHDLYRICRAMTKDEQSAVKTVADLYFPVDGNGYRINPRASVELRLAAPAMEAARLNGKTGGRPKKEPNEFENKNPVGFQLDTQLVSNLKAPHSLEEYREAKASLSASPPDCPHEDLIDLYAKHLPNLAQPRKSLWRKGKNAPALKARWIWVLTACYEKGERKDKRMATNLEEGMEWFERLFEYVAKCDWLMGKAGTWECDLAWIVNSSNFEKIISGRYENTVVASA